MATVPARRALSSLSDAEERADVTEIYQGFKGASSTMLDGAAVRGADACFVTGSNGARFVTVFADGVASISTQAIDGLRARFGPQTHLVHKDGTVTAVLPLLPKRDPITSGEVAQWMLWSAALVGSFLWLETQTLAVASAKALVMRAG